MGHREVISIKNVYFKVKIAEVMFFLAIFAH